MKLLLSPSAVWFPKPSPCAKGAESLFKNHIVSTLKLIRSTSSFTGKDEISLGLLESRGLGEK